MADYDDDGETTDPILNDARSLAWQSMRQFNQVRRSQSGRVEIPASVQADLIEGALAYYDALEKYRDERVLEEDWGERDIEWIDQARHQTVTVSVDRPTSNGATKQIERRKLMDVPASLLAGVIRELEKVAHELGFIRRARSPTPNEEASKADLAGLLKARGQDDALENLPWDMEADD